MKKRAEKKIDMIICKLQDLYYMSIPEHAIVKLNETLGKARELQSRIEDEDNWQR